MEYTVKWRYRVKFFEKVYYIGLLSFGFLVYKSPSLLTWLIYDHTLMTITFFSSSIIGFSVLGYYLDKRSRWAESLAKKLKNQLKDAKRRLISEMDPIVVEAVKEIIRADMSEEIERLRNSEDGCSEKCRLTIGMHKLNVDRHEVLTQELIQFKWCDQCMRGQPGAAQQVCQNGCGPRLYSKLLPHMKEFGKGTE